MLTTKVLSNKFNGSLRYCIAVVQDIAGRLGATGRPCWLKSCGRRTAVDAPFEVHRLRRLIAANKRGPKKRIVGVLANFHPST